LGLNASIVASARQNLTAREAQLAEHLAKIDRDMRALEHEQRLAVRERETLEAAEGRLREREEVLKQREQQFRQRLSDELEAETRGARKEIDEVVSELKAKTAAIARESTAHAVTTGETGALRGEARAAVDAVVKRVLQPSEPEQASGVAHEYAVGDHVLVGLLGLEGVINAIHEGSAEVDVRGKRMRAPIRDLKFVRGPVEPRDQVSRIKVHVDLRPHDDVGADLNVVGCTVDEALARTERFLDQSLLTDQRVIRVIHGYGTGQLKRAL